MKCLLCAGTVIEETSLLALRSALEDAGIACEIRHEALGTQQGAVPFSECFQELWIAEDHDYEKALALQQNHEALASGSFTPWQCSGCQEMNDGHFSVCWKCGEESPD